ncbi:MAG: DUF1343 domain-containing protein [Bacteroidales bacterium]|jgi:uncharacterized protein YbbC (DUF1343 family)|nr:DUF1343 domain-containing protein [Bacteroidales bacterium]
MRFLSFILLMFFLPVFSHASNAGDDKLLTGAEQPGLYVPLLQGKSVAIVANQTSMVGDVHIVDFLMDRKVNPAGLRAIFAAEHGYRDLASDGDLISDSTDPSTGLPVISMYGSHRKPLPEDLKGIDIVIFDIQDVGVRFYTYISTLSYLMEACAENDVKCIVLDRPNPNGFYVDGNIPDTAWSSFVCLHPVPVVHGMTVGEYALMVNGEGWLKGGIKCDLTVIRCTNYTHQTYYELPVKPSPNLPDQTSVYLYPSLCLFEGTNISVGRGTEFPFKVYGSPLLPGRGFSFIPQSMQGSANPPLKGVKCYGTDLRDARGRGLVPRPHINLGWLLEAYREYPAKDEFFLKYFDVLAGGPVLREQIISGMTEDEIRETWKEGLGRFMEIRARYLLYD